MASQKWQSPYDDLTEREVEILGLLAEGLTDREIAERLIMTINTVKWYNRQIYSILGVGSRTQAIARARELQLLGEEKSFTPPALIIHSQPKNNLPVESTQFIGRKSEMESILRLLDTAHLLTLVGPPGTGKTRLALRIAWEVVDTFRDGVYFVSLAPINDPVLVINTIACAIGVDETNDQPLIDTLKNVFRQSQMLLILDNFEHLLSAATQISELLSAAPGLKVLATSREPLHLYAEQEYVVPPLALPDLANLDPKSLADCESTALFVQQARAVRSDFSITPENALDVANICIRLEGLPLAIELAAARIKLLLPQTLLARLTSRLDTLTGGARDLPARQQTLHNTIEWSYNLLNDGEKLLFAQLAVFRGSFSVDAVEAVCDDGLDVALDTSSTVHLFDRLESLVNKSLVQQKELSGGEPRFIMLETLHEYAWERLGSADLHSETANRHSAYYLERVTRYEAALFGMESQTAVVSLRNDLDNIRQAWQWAIDHLMAENAATGQSLVAPLHAAIDGLAAFYQVANLFEEGQGVFARSAEAVVIGGRDLESVRCHLLARVAEFAEWRGDVDRVYTAATEVIQLADRPEMQRYRADALRSLGILDRESGATEQAIQYLQKAITIYHSLDAKRPLAIAYDWLGLLNSDLRRLDEAMDCLGRAAALYAEEGNERGIVFNKGMTAVVLSVMGRLEESLVYQRDVLVGYQKLNYPVGMARTANNLGLVLLELGEFKKAKTELEHAGQIYLQIGNTASFHNALGNKGEVHLALDEYDEAWRCFQQAGQFFREIGKQWLESENLWRRGWLLVNKGEYEQAQSALEDCLSLASEDENPEAFAIAHGLLGKAAWRLGNPEKALVHFDRTAKAFKVVRRHLTVGRFAIILKATLLLEQGNITAAETTLNEVWPLLGEAGRNPIVFESRHLQARITAAYGNDADARQQLERLLASSLRPVEQAAAHFELWRLRNDEEHGRQALALYQQLAAHSPNQTYHDQLATLQAASLERPSLPDPAPMV
jgi:predicted ATPase/DNA-binding CsgD family transcriptional regulator